VHYAIFKIDLIQKSSICDVLPAIHNKDRISSLPIYLLTQNLTQPENYNFSFCNLHLIACLCVSFFSALPPIAWSCFLFVSQIEIFDFIPGPWGFPQKLQTGLDAWIIIKAPYIDNSAQFTPPEIFHKFCENIFQSDTVKRIMGVLVVHELARSISPIAVACCLQIKLNSNCNEHLHFIHLSLHS